MNPRRVLIANSPRAYREAIAGTIGHLRPSVSISVFEPDELELEVLRQRPDVVICSRLLDALQHEVRTWVVLYPEERPHALVISGGKTWAIPDVQLATLLSLVDGVPDLAQMS